MRALTNRMQRPVHAGDAIAAVEAEQADVARVRGMVEQLLAGIAARPAPVDAPAVAWMVELIERGRTIAQAAESNLTSELAEKTAPSEAA